MYHVILITLQFECFCFSCVQHELAGDVHFFLPKHALAQRAFDQLQLKRFIAVLQAMMAHNPFEVAIYMLVVSLFLQLLKYINEST